MNVFEWQAKQTKTAGELYAHALEHTPKDKWDWEPKCDDSSKTRSALDQIRECVQINRWAAASLVGETPPEWVKEQLEAEITVDTAPQKIRESAALAAKAIAGCSESVLGTKYPSPMGETSGAFMISIVPNNMIYHFGQLNYIQLLYGDTEFRFPDLEA